MKSRLDVLCPSPDDDLLLSLKESFENLYKERDNHKKTQRSFDKKIVRFRKRIKVLDNRVVELLNQQRKVQAFTEYLINEGRVTDEELSKYFTQKNNIWKTNA